MSYPVAFDIARGVCLVVGGGRVAGRKVEGLISAGGRVKVVAPRISEALSGFEREGSVEIVRRTFTPGDVSGAMLVFAATDDPEVNEAVVGAARAAGVPVNSADGEGDFNVPAVLRFGEVTIAVDTGGNSPALAAWIRDGLAKTAPEGLAELAGTVGKMREARSGGISPEAWRTLFDSGFPGDLARGDREAAAAKADRILGVEASPETGKGRDLT